MIIETDKAVPEEGIRLLLDINGINGVTFVGAEKEG